MFIDIVFFLDNTFFKFFKTPPLSVQSFSSMITFGVSLYNLPVSPLWLITPSLKSALWERGQSEGGQELSDRVEMSELLLDAICHFQSWSLRLLI